MNDLEQRVREAFDEVSLPPEVRARTLAAIDDLVQPREASPSKPPAPVSYTHLTLPTIA